MNHWVEPLEHRLLLSATLQEGQSAGSGDGSISLRFGVLRVNGSGRNDSIRLIPQTTVSFPNGAPQITARSVFVQVGAQTAIVPLKLIAHVEINSGGGNDLIQLLPLSLNLDPCDGILWAPPFWGPEHAARIDGGAGDDTITGSSRSDTIFGGAGNDDIYGNGGNDRIFAGGGDDSIAGGRGSDRIETGGGADRIWGEAGNDTILGEHGDDQIFGGGGDDLIRGGGGRNAIEAAGGVRHIFDRPVVCPL